MIALNGEDPQDEIHLDENEAYHRGLAKIGGNQGTEIQELLEKEDDNSNTDLENDDDKSTDSDMKGLEGIKNAYYKTFAIFSRLSLSMNTDDMTRIITDAMKQLHI